MNHSMTDRELDDMLARHECNQRDVRRFALLFGAFIGAAGVGAIWIIVTWI